MENFSIFCPLHGRDVLFSARGGGGFGVGGRGILNFWSIPNVSCNMFPMAPQLKFPNHASFFREGSLFRLLCWGIESSCSQGKAQACIQGALLFFLVNFGRRGGDFFSFFFGSQCVPQHVQWSSSFPVECWAKTIFLSQIGMQQQHDRETLIGRIDEMSVRDGFRGRNFLPLQYMIIKIILIFNSNKINIIILFINYKFLKFMF
jgi:hypothetical protein